MFLSLWAKVYHKKYFGKVVFFFFSNFGHVLTLDLSAFGQAKKSLWTLLFDPRPQDQGIRIGRPIISFPTQ